MTNDAGSPRSLERTKGPEAPARPTLTEARRAARDRYALIAEAIKIEAGVSRHYTHKQHSGVAWMNDAKILAPEGVTRRQLYVLAHECAHVVLHRTPAAMAKAGHVKEHEAEVYAHRSFARYGLDVPEKSSRWARSYVGQWIMKDQADGKIICPRALAFAQGREGPDAALPALHNQPPNDFSGALKKQLERAEKTVAAADRQVQIVTPKVQVLEPDLSQIAHRAQAAGPPVACGTCLYVYGSGTGDQCRAHDKSAVLAFGVNCRGSHWRPHPRELRRLRYRRTGPGFWSRLGDAIIERIRGRR